MPYHGYTLDMSPATTIAICRVCGTRRAACTRAGARRLMGDHLAAAHGGRTA